MKAAALAVAMSMLAACSAKPGDPDGNAAGPIANVSVPSPAAAPLVPVNRAAPAPEPVGDPRLAVDGEGLRWFLPDTGAARSIPFGQPQAAVLAALERVRGPAGRGVNQDCGAGPVQYANWPDGLSLVFQEGSFVGWGLDGRAAGAVTTAAGIGPGSTRGALTDAHDATFEQTSLGTEFAAGALYGVLDGPGANARITDMWAGISCAAR